MSRHISILGLVFNGEPVDSTRQAILESTGLPVLLEIERTAHIDADWVNEQAGRLSL